MSEKQDVRSKSDVIETLRRVGVREETIQALAAVLPDPVDLQRDENLFAQYGVTRERLVERMGGSP